MLTGILDQNNRLFAAPYTANPGLSPISIGTLPTFWYDGDNSPQYKTISTSGGACTLDGDACGRGDSIAGATIRCIAGTGGFYEVPAIGSAKGYSRSSLALGGTGLYNRPAGAANPTVPVTIADLFTASDQVIITAVQVNAADPNNGPGAAYANGEILSDSTGGYMGFSAYQTGANIVFQAWNYDGAERVVTATVLAGTPVIATRKFSGGVVRIRINGVEIGSVASGNTTVTGGQLFTGGRIDLRMAQMCTYDANISDANILEVERYFAARTGIII